MRVRLSLAATAVALATVPLGGTANATIWCATDEICTVVGIACRATKPTQQLCSVA